MAAEVPALQRRPSMFVPIQLTRAELKSLLVAFQPFVWIPEMKWLPKRCGGPDKPDTKCRKSIGVVYAGLTENTNAIGRTSTGSANEV